MGNGLADILKLCMANFVPSEQQRLSVKDWRSINKVHDVLDAGPVDGCFAFEDTDFKLLTKLIEWVAPLILRRNSPKMVDALAAAEGKMPEASPDGVAEVPITEFVGV